MRPAAALSTLATIAVLALLQSGCGVLIGNVKPVTQRSGEYDVMELTSQSRDWIRLASESQDEEGDGGESRNSDLAYQSASTASIISMNSACRERVRAESKSLRDYTDLLILGMTEIESRIERPVQIDRTPGLQTTFKGRLGGQDVTIRTIVVRRRQCIYDLIYVSRPGHFERDKATFDRFALSVRFR